MSWSKQAVGQFPVYFTGKRSSLIGRELWSNRGFDCKNIRIGVALQLKTFQSVRLSVALKFFTTVFYSAFS